MTRLRSDLIPDIRSEAWLATMKVGGSMLGSALGDPEARRRWAAGRGQRWVADKSGLWEQASFIARFCLLLFLGVKREAGASVVSSRAPAR
jgi:hypothetical protein